jgi:ABC-type antimicrobial peptide transport system permease subunit
MPAASRVFSFVEAAVLALAAGAAGVGLAAALLKFLRPYAAQRLPFATEIAVDARAVLMTVGLSAVTAVLIGMLPAMSARREDLVTRLRGGAGGARTRGRRPTPLSATLSSRSSSRWRSPC